MGVFFPSIASSSASDDLLSRRWGNEDWYYDFSEDPGVSWQNQDTATVDFGEGGAVVVAGAPSELNVMWMPESPPAGDWLYMVELSQLVLGGDNSLGGLVALIGGTEASPTEDGLLLAVHYHNNTNGPGIAMPTWDSYTTFGAPGGNPYCDANTQSWRRVYIIMGYIDVSGIYYIGMHGGYNSSAGGEDVTYQSRGSFAAATSLGITVGASGSTGDTQYHFHRAKLLSNPSGLNTWPIPELIGR